MSSGGASSAGRVWAIAGNTFREAVRNKILYALLVLALLMIVSGMFLGRLALDQNIRIVQDFGLFFLSFFGMVIAVVVGVNLLYDEVNRRTVYVLLATPLRRFEFLLGKYVGMLLVLAVQVVAMASVMTLLLGLQGGPLDSVLAQAFALAYVELAVITAVAILFSSFSTPYLSGFFTFGVFILGRLSGELLRLLPTLEPAALRTTLRVVANCLPGLWRFDFTARVVHGQPVGWDTLSLTALYGFTYAAVALCAAIFIFNRRDFV